jgi:hypothetical protein
MRPSLRTASLLGTDYKSEAVGLIACVNETYGSNKEPLLGNNQPLMGNNQPVL